MHDIVCACAVTHITHTVTQNQLAPVAKFGSKSDPISLGIRCVAEGGSEATTAMVGAMAMVRAPRWISAADMQCLRPICRHGKSVLLSAETPREMELRAR